MRKNPPPHVSSLCRLALGVFYAGCLLAPLRALVTQLDSPLANRSELLSLPWTARDW